jgi:hypothetical protein
MPSNTLPHFRTTPLIVYLPLRGHHNVQWAAAPHKRTLQTTATGVNPVQDAEQVRAENLAGHPPRLQMMTRVLLQTKVSLKCAPQLD